MGAVNVFLLIAGFFLPPVAVILMAAPILLPIITTAGFDPIWFAVVLTINMEIGLISPPVGLNLYVINGIAPDISLKTILTGSLPFVACMVIAIILLCIFPGLATWLPDGDGDRIDDLAGRSSVHRFRAPISRFFWGRPGTTARCRT
jgi:C4-dicarboxylate transporter DctM subunit